MQKSPEDLSGTFYLQYSFLQRDSQNIMSKIPKQKGNLKLLQWQHAVMGPEKCHWP